jgi:predicted RNA-binding protein with PUA-like domain
MQYWLMKTEPEVFSIQDLAKAKKKTTHWDGVRNYQARNFMRDQMKVGDGVLIYHSNADPSCVVGTAVVSREAYPDFTAFDRNDPHYDPKSKVESPTWYMVDVTLESIFASPLSLAELRTVAALAKMELLRKGSRLSVQPVRPAEFARICKLGQSQE